MDNQQTTRVLFICDRNAARGQIAEAFMKKHGEGRFVAESAGFAPAPVLPEAVTAMKEAGIDITTQESNSVVKFFAEGRIYKYVISMCDESRNDKCPVFPGISAHYYWNIEAPHLFEGSAEEKLALTRKVRDELEKKIIDWVKHH